MELRYQSEKQTENNAPKNKQNKTKTPALRLGTWNVRTMCPGLNEDHQQIEDARKTAIIDRELSRLNYDIVALQETRLPSNGSLREKNFTFYWQGLEPDERRLHGVGFAIRNSLLSSVEPPSQGTERILSVRLHTPSGFTNILCIYAPTLTSSDDTKDAFYEQLDEKIKNVPPSEELYLLGDFNARVGADQESWPRCIGHFGIGKQNENGQRLLELCSYYDLCITNTFFSTKSHHRASWKHPRSHHWHQLDLIITRRSSLNNVLITRTYHSADCDTDHSLVGSKVRLHPKRIHHSKQKGRPRINTARVSLPALRERFSKEIDEALKECPDDSDCLTSKWNHIRDTVYATSAEIFGKKERKNEDWFDAGIDKMEPVIEEKRALLLELHRNPTKKTRAAYNAARNKSKQTARSCANDYWQNLCSNIQTSADMGNARGMYQGMKKAFGPSATKTAPLKSTSGEVITEPSKQMDRWAEHYKELYSKETHVSDLAIEKTAALPTMEELDTPPSLDELKKAIEKLACDKAPGNDGIPPEILKAGKDSSLIHHLHDLLLQCWEDGTVPQDMRDSKIITLYKNKGERSDCNNYRGISLLSIVGKAYARVVLNRLQKLAERVYPESQCGFRASRSTIDMVFSVRQLQEKCRKQRRPLYLAFIDLTKAFDYVSRDGLFSLLEKIGCPPKLLAMVKAFHSGMMSTVQYNGSSSDPFPVSNGVKQGCVLAPTLFGIFFSLLLRYAFGSSEDGIFLHTRSDGNLFNLARLRAKSKVISVLIRELLFADDAALAAHSEQALQRLITCFADACREFGLTISLKKTEVMGQDVSEVPKITIGDHMLGVTDTFTYLGSKISSNLTLDAELNTRIGKAASAMSKLSKRVWENRKLTINTKMKVYQACVLSTLLYGSEAWTLYARQERRLNTFHMRCIRRLLGITWQDRVRNEEVLKRAGTRSMHCILKQKRLRWLGHVCRMQDRRIPKDLLFGELALGTRPRGRPNLRYKDVCKRDLKECGINPADLQAAASDRAKWRGTIGLGSRQAEERRISLKKKRREERKLRAASTPSTPGQEFTCTKCRRACRSRIGLHSHSRRCKS